jgi:hypothetical protein
MARATRQCALIAAVMLGAEYRVTASPSSSASEGSADGDGPVRLSLPTEADRAAWLRSGFRLGLGLSYGMLHGQGAVPDFTTWGVTVRPGIRLDPQWSIYLSFQYEALAREGARFASAIEPTWHITRYLAAGVGLGYAGIAGYSRFDRMPLQPTVDALGQSYTFPDAKRPLPICTGVGLTALARLELGYVLGPRTRTHVAMEALEQWTGCEDASTTIDSFSGKQLVRRQWWAHTGASLSWGIEWR